MARIRTIKPEFFTSEDIVSLSPLSRLFYVSLWCEADREGRLEWKPRTFKLRYFPGDDCDIDQMCNDLIEAGLVVIYEVDGKQYAEIPTFTEHQIINNRESESKIPSRVTGTFDASGTRESGEKAEGKGKEGKGKEGREGNMGSSDDDLAGSDDPAVPACPHQAIIDLYHRLVPTGVQVRVWGEDRQKLLRARWREDASRQSLDWWERFFGYIAQSEFLTGQSQAAAGRDPFVVSLDWLVSPRNFAKAIEGRYHREAA
ncbi:hypothetical protein [Alcaligenes sp. WGS1538]|uniref:hypothetical protein n=1 Tax=Alcaligenes sp. WGS1538 TaxID=3366811 RepID=UPI00372D7CFB